MPEALTQYAAVLVGLVVGVASGLAPLILGILRRRRGLGISGLLVCALAGALGGLLVAVPLAILFSAGVLRGARKPITRRVPYPPYCSFAFVLALVFCVVAWVILLIEWEAAAFDASFQQGVHENIQVGIQLLWGITWIVAPVGVVANCLLLLRYRAGLWLGWLLVIGEATAIPLTYSLVMLSEATEMRWVLLAGGRANVLAILAFRGVFLLTYVAALVWFRNWSIEAAAAALGPSDSPAWMKETRISPSRNGWPDGAPVTRPV
jgi:hypothetical protein